MLATGFVAQGAMTAVSQWRQHNDPDPLWVTDPLPSNYHIFVTKHKEVFKMLRLCYLKILAGKNCDRKRQSNSWMGRRAVRYRFTDLSEELSVPFFGLQELILSFLWECLVNYCYLLLIHFQPMIYNFSLASLFGRVQENQKGFKLNGTHQFLVYIY